MKRIHCSPKLGNVVVDFLYLDQWLPNFPGARTTHLGVREAQNIDLAFHFVNISNYLNKTTK